MGFQWLFPDSKFLVIQGAQAFLGYRLYGPRRDRVGEVFQGQWRDVRWEGTNIRGTDYFKG